MSQPKLDVIRHYGDSCSVTYYQRGQLVVKEFRNHEQALTYAQGVEAGMKLAAAVLSDNMTKTEPLVSNE